MPRRVSLEAGDEGAVWFDCYSYPWENGSMHFALPADSTVRAERALRDFVQTLTKTFADLPIGLAIFDQQRQLQMFNPALLDLTQLGPDFLSARPTLYAFLDRLREARMMPEPKDYRSWRLQMTELEKASAAGFHVETRSLPGGRPSRHRAPASERGRGLPVRRYFLGSVADAPVPRRAGAGPRGA
ncbi:MAG: hypothetical protein R3D78_00325 [Paracoccaceae bacterium]